MPPQTSAGSSARWHELAQSPEFKRLESLRRWITYSTLGIFAIASGSFLVLSGYDRSFMRKSVDGGLTVAYVWLLALTVLAWVLVLVYLRLAGGPVKRLVDETREAQGVASSQPSGESPRPNGGRGSREATA